MADESKGAVDDIQQGCFGSLVLFFGLTLVLGFFVYKIVL